MIKIGSYIVPTKYILAPMSGVTDLAFRLIAREHGAKFCFYEMIDTHSVIYHRKKTFSILKTTASDNPIALQLLGSDPHIILKAAREILPLLNVSFIDINAACPVRKVMKKRAGAYLLKERHVLYDTIKLLSQSLNLPITVKIRLAHEKESIDDIIDLSRRCEALGASALFVHGRTRLQLYSGDINYEAIRRIKESVKIPVIASGNILSGKMAKRMISETYCDGLLIARGAMGNPWIFKSIENYIETGYETDAPSQNEKKDVMKRHISYIIKHTECSESGKMGMVRATMLWYIKSFPHAKKIRAEICLVNNYEKMIKLIDEI